MNDILDVLKRSLLPKTVEGCGRINSQIRGRNIHSRAKEWWKYGFSADEVEQWIKVEVYRPREAAKWRKENFTPEDVKAWKEVYINEVEPALKLKTVGISPDEIHYAYRVGSYVAVRLMVERFINGIISKDEINDIVDEWKRGNVRLPLKLTVDPVPRSLWGKSLHKILPWELWSGFRREARKKYPDNCGICGAVSDVYEFHEVWSYDFDTKTASINDIIPLCDMCHAVKHWGRSEKIPGLRNKIIPHWITVNEIDLIRPYEFFPIHIQIRYMDEVISNYRKLDAIQWSPQKEIVELIDVKNRNAFQSESKRVLQLIASIYKKLGYTTLPV